MSDVVKNLSMVAALTAGAVAINNNSILRKHSSKLDKMSLESRNFVRQYTNNNVFNSAKIEEIRSVLNLSKPLVLSRDRYDRPFSFMGPHLEFWEHYNKLGKLSVTVGNLLDDPEPVFALKRYHNAVEEYARQTFPTRPLSIDLDFVFIDYGDVLPSSKFDLRYKMKRGSRWIYVPETASEFQGETEFKLTVEIPMSTILDKKYIYRCLYNQMLSHADINTYLRSVEFLPYAVEEDSSVVAKLFSSSSGDTMFPLYYSENDFRFLTKAQQIISGTEYSSMKEQPSDYELAITPNRPVLRTVSIRSRSFASITSFLNKFDY